MSPVEFLKAVWPTKGFYCIAVPATGYKGYEHHVFDTVLKAANFCELHKLDRNIFFATNTLREEKVWNLEHHRKKGDSTWQPGWSVRLQTNMLKCRIIFADLDVGDDPKKYATQMEAATELRRFCGETGLPRPMVTSSGGGLHVYWILSEDLDTADWLVEAQRFKAIATHHGLKYDPARITDSASVLRVPGTYNLKLANNPREVRVLMQPEVVELAHWRSVTAAAAAAAQIAPVTPSLPPLLGTNTTVEYKGSPPGVKTVMKICAQARRWFSLRGVMSEPEWRVMIGTMKFVKEADMACHELSKGDPRYTKDKTDAKMQRWTKGPAMCSNIADICGKENGCSECPLFAHNSSPIPLAARIETKPKPRIREFADEAVSFERVIPDPPMPYSRTEAGVTILMEDDNGKTERVVLYPYDLYPIDRSNSESKEIEQQLWRVHLPNTEPRDFTIEASTFVDEKALRIRLANIGIYNSNTMRLQKYMSAYIQELQKLSSASKQYSHLGWTEGREDFVLGERVLSATGDKPTALDGAARGAKRYVSKTGTLTKQVELMHFYDDPRYIAHQFFVMAGLASPIFYATGYHGIIVSAYGLSGSSKSTMLEAAAAFWGHPSKYVMNGTTDGATHIARISKREVLGNLPFCLDEITHIASDVARGMAMNATQAIGRERAARTGDLKVAEDLERSTIIMTTANRSLQAMLEGDNKAGTAAALRVMEIEFTPQLFHTPAEGIAFTRELRENYGNIGEAYMRMVVRIRAAMEKRVVHTFEDLATKGKMTSDERFWFAEAASTLVGTEIVNKMGLISWDRSAMENWFLHSQLPFMRGTVSTAAQGRAPLVVLDNFMNRFDAAIVRASTRGLGGNQYDIRNRSSNELIGHYDMDHGFMHLLKGRFREYCEQQGVSSLELMRQLFAAKIITNMGAQRTLGAGTDLAKGQSLCFTVNMRHPAVLALKPPIDTTAGRPDGSILLKP